MNMARAQILNKYVVKDHFDKLKAVLLTLNIFTEPSRIYNMNKKMLD